MPSSPDIPVNVPETGTRREFKLWLLAELFGWQCERGHIVMRYEAEQPSPDTLQSFPCVYCYNAFWRTRKARIRKMHNSVRPVR